MKKTLRMLLLGLSFLLPALLSAQNTITFGYCPEETSPAVQILTVSDDASASIKAAIRIPGARLQALKGARITKIRFAADEGITTTYAWLRPSIDSTAYKGTNTRVGTTVQGWNEVTLKTPYVITGSDVVAGYGGTLPAGKGIWFDGKTNANGCFASNGSVWEDLSSYGYGSLCIQVVIESDTQLPTDDIALEGCTWNRTFTRIGEPATATLTIANYGTKTVSAPALTYSLAGAPEQTVKLTGTLEPEDIKTFSVELPTDGCVDGNNLFKARIDAGDTYQGNNSLETYLPCYTESFAHKTLLEHFTTLPCVNCPAGDATLHTLLAGRKDYVWVSHHVGYGEDELTQSASYDIYNLSGISGAPYAMLDRRILPASEGERKPGFGIGYANATQGAEILKPSYEQCASTVAFASVDIANAYDAATRTLTTTVSGARKALLDVFYPGALLTVMLVEDDVFTQEKQKGNDSQIHSNVFRQALTPILGEPVNWSGDTYTATYTATLPEKWQAGKVRVVAFIARPDKGDKTQLDVINANELAATAQSTTGIDGVTAAGSIATRTETFGLDGRRLNGATRGVTIERITHADGTVSVTKRIR